jgi:hypothetical protein
MITGDHWLQKKLPEEKDSTEQLTDNLSLLNCGLWREREWRRIWVVGKVGEIAPN